jgi:hypothetical protein
MDDGTVKTDLVVSARKLRRILGLERDEKLGTSPIGTCKGEWRLEPDGQWRAWDYADQDQDEEVA